MFDELRICWRCGKIGEDSKHCISCDRNEQECECENPILWEHFKCPACGATW